MNNVRYTPNSPSGTDASIAVSGHSSHEHGSSEIAYDSPPSFFSDLSPLSLMLTILRSRCIILGAKLYINILRSFGSMRTIHVQIWVEIAISITVHHTWCIALH